MPAPGVPCATAADCDAPRTITLKLRRGGQGYVAEATMVEGDKLTGNKTLTHPDCAMLVEAMAAVFTVRRDPPPKPAPVRPPAPPPPRKPPRFVAEAGALAALGASPGPASRRRGRRRVAGAGVVLMFVILRDLSRPQT